MASNKPLKGIGTEGASASGGKDGRGWISRLLRQPLTEEGCDVGAQRGRSVLATFSEASDVSAGVKLHILAPKGGDLRVAQPSLNSHMQEGSVAAANPSRRIRSFKEGCSFLGSEELHGGTFIAFGWDRKDALTMECERRIIEADVAKECMKGREAIVPGANGVAPFLFKVF
jgi:hypothetical protein